MEKHVAIIGGGTAGLSAAFFLHNYHSHDRRSTYHCTVFEASSRLGGNCDSAYLGQQSFSEPFADLGVNDFNSRRYRLLMWVLGKLESAGYPIPHQPIIDSTTWSMPACIPKEQRLTYTDRELKNWPDQQDPSRRETLRNIATDWQRFQEISREVMQDSRFAQTTVDAFTEEMAFSKDFNKYNLHACINGMFFVDETSPGSMPIRPIINYYYLQKGVSMKGMSCGQVHGESDHKSSRHYFVNGASDWIRQLSQYLRDQGVEMRLGAMPIASRNPDGSWRVVSSASQHNPRERFDLVISAVHAEKVQTVIPSGLPEKLPPLLREFSYSESTAVVHDDASILPGNPEAWSTYNLMIYPSDIKEKRSYTITYLERKHHGEDTTSPPFVTLMPSWLEGKDVNTQVLSMPDPGRIRVKAKFRHNMLSMGAYEAQKGLSALQGENNVYLTGGWTIGVGLQEEILAMSREVALRIRGHYVSGVHDESYKNDRPSYVPKYLRDTMLDEPELFPPGFWN